MQAATRGAELERAAREAAQSEVSVDELHQWLEAVAHRLDDRRPPGDRLEEEFRKQRELLRDVERQARAHREAGRPEAAQRLEDQLQLLQRRFEDAEHRLAAVRSAEGADGDVGARLAAAAGALAAVQRDCARSLPLAGADPDAVRAQLRTCLVSTF